MESQCTLHGVKTETGASHDKMPLLPKNCVALVGNTPVILGQQLVLVNKNAIPTTVQEVDIKQSPSKSSPSPSKSSPSPSKSSPSPSKSSPSPSKSSPVSYVPTTTDTATTVYAAGASSTFATTQKASRYSGMTVREQIGLLKTSRMIKALAKQIAKGPTDPTASDSVDGNIIQTKTSSSAQTAHAPLKLRLRPKKKLKICRSLLAKPQLISKPQLIPKPNSSSKVLDGDQNNSYHTSKIVPVPAVASFSLQEVTLSHRKSAHASVCKSYAVNTITPNQILPAGSVVQVKSINPGLNITHVTDNDKTKLVNHPQLIDCTQKIVQMDSKSLASVALTPSVSGSPGMSMVIGSIASLGPKNESQIFSSSAPTYLKQGPSTAPTFLKQIPSTGPTFLKQTPSTAPTFLKEKSGGTTMFVKPGPPIVVKRSESNQLATLVSKPVTVLPSSKPVMVLPSHPMKSPTTIVPSINTMASSQPCPTLQTILAMPVSQFQSYSLLTNSNLKPGLTAPNSFRNFPSTAYHWGDFQGEEKSVPATSNVECYTSLEKYEQGQPVMVMRPVLDPDLLNDNNSNSSEALLSATGENQTQLTTSLNKKEMTTASDRVTHNGQDVIFVKEDIKKATKVRDQFPTDDFPMNLRIQSVFSLADMPSSEDINFEEGMENAVDVSQDEVGGMNCESEEETTYNIHGDTWKSMCPPSYVVLERLYPQDIKKKLIGEKKSSVHCSHHCRERTLSLLCSLNLMPCEHKVNINSITETELPNLSTSPAPLTVKLKRSEKIEQQSKLKAAKTAEGANHLPLTSDDRKKNEKRCDEIEPSGFCATDSKRSELKVCAKEESLLSNNKQEEPPSQKKAEITKDIKKDTSEIKQPLSTSTLQRISSTNTLKDEYDQLERDIISLKIQVEEKRRKMHMQKMQHHLSTFKTNLDSKDKSDDRALPADSTDLTKQSRKLLPVVLGSLLKSNTTLASQHLEKRAVKTKTGIPLTQKKIIQPKPSLSAVSSTSATTTIPSFVTNLPASSLFGNSAGKKTGNNLLTPVQVMPAHQIPSLPPEKNKPPMGLHLGKVYAALHSLAEHFKSMGHTPTGTQFVMLKNAGSTSPVILKIEPDALLPQNLEVLKKNAESSFPSSMGNSRITAQVKPLPHKVNASSSSSLSSTLPPTSVPVHKSTAQPVSVRPTYQSNAPPACQGTISNSEKVLSRQTPTTVQKINSPPGQITISPAYQEIVSNNQKSLSSQNPILVKRINSTATEKTQCSPQIIKSKENSYGSTSSSMISLLLSNRSPVNSSSSQSSRHSLLSTNFNSTKSSLTHVPLTSSLLPERQNKRSTDHLSAEERAAKRRKFEEKYPLPPNVIIKCEPDSSEYELDNNWSVTSEIQTGYVTSTETTDFDNDHNHSSRMGDALNSLSGMSVENDNHSNSQRTMFIESDTDTASDYDMVDDTDSPPPLDSVQLSNSNVEKDDETFQMDTNETPPVLQPMASLSVNKPSLLDMEDKEEPSHNSVTASQQQPIQIYDSGYDSVGPSSSSESLGRGRSQGKQLLSTQKSKIEQLKEILKQKQQKVESIMRKRSTMPEVDLDAL